MRHKAKPLRTVALEQHIAEKPLAKRMVAGLGEEGFQIAKALQSIFGATVVHYHDSKGQVGKQPEWGNL